MSHPLPQLHSLMPRRYSMRQTRLLILFIASGFLLTSCKTSYHETQQVSVPESWSYAKTESNQEKKEESYPIWLVSCFDDTSLKELLELSHDYNLDLKTAEIRIKQARSYYKISASQQLPSINFDTSATYNHLSKNTASAALYNSSGYSSNLFDGGFDATWEIDLFGKIAQQKKAATFDLQAAHLQKEAMWIRLSGEIARNYFLWCGYQIQADLLKESINTYEQTLELTKRKAEVGTVSALDLAQAKAHLAQAKAYLPPIQALANQTLHQLDLLVGKAPGFLSQKLISPSHVPQSLRLPDLGIPSDLLRRRPDVLAAEYQLKSAAGLKKAAELDFFPSFTLSGALGHQSMFADDLAKSSSHYWSFIPGLRLPLFNAGRLKAKLKLSKAKQEEALYFYEKTILGALEEVESTLSHIKKTQDQCRFLHEAVTAQKQVLEIAYIQYEKGLVSFLNVLQAQSALLENQNSLVSAQVALASHTVSLCKALSGSWTHASKHAKP